MTVRLISVTKGALLLMDSYPISLIWFLMMNLVKGLLEKNSLKFVFCFVSLVSSFIFSEINVNPNKTRLIILKDVLYTAFNSSIVIILFSEVALYDSLDRETLFTLFNIFFGEILFLQEFHFKLFKGLSLAFFSLFFLFHFEFDDSNCLLIIFSMLFSFLNCRFENLKHKIKKILKKFDESYFPDSSDIIFEIGKNLEPKVNCPNFNQYIKENNISKRNFFLTLLKTKILIKNEYSCRPTNKEIIDDLLKNECGMGSKESVFEPFLKEILMKKNECHFWLAEGSILNEERVETLMLLNDGHKILIKIKLDYFYKENKKLRSMNGNYSKAIYFVAHEFRTPLNCILSMLQSLNQNVNETLNDIFISPALISSKVLLNLVNDLLDIAQVEANTFKLMPIEFDFIVLLEDTLQIISYQAKARGISLKINVHSTLKKIISDPNRIRQVIVNLLSNLWEGNALKYTTKGSISLTALHINSDQIQIKVTDTGLGIDTTNIQKLFKAFGKIKNEANSALNAQGVGLGLLISNTLANILNKEEGGIEVESVMGIGSTFSFTLYDLTFNDSVPMSSHRTDHLRSLQYKFIQNYKSEKASISELLELTTEHKIYEASLNQEAPESKVDILNDSLLIDRSKHIGSDLNLKKGSSNLELVKRAGSFFFVSDFNNFRNMSSKNFEAKDLIDSKLEVIKSMMKSRNCRCPVALIIDDNDFNILALLAHLSRFEIPAVSALGGNDALRIIKNMKDNECCNYFKLIFLDLEMPIKNGLETFDEIKEFYKTAEITKSYIISVTGYSQGCEMAQLALAKGVKDVLTKPISQDILVWSINLKWLTD